MADRRKNYGLVHKGLRVELQEVSPSHQKLCEQCGQLPEGLRAMLTYGSGRHATTTVLCASEACAQRFMLEQIRVYSRALGVLEHGDFECLDGETVRGT